jgi:SAM-dependent methyltransferase
MISDNEPWSSDESQTVIERYEARLRKYGFGEEALGWGKKGRQQLRFSVLASHWDLRGKTVLDLGAGFGDFYEFSKQLHLREYVGIDLTPGLVAAGNKKYGSNQGFSLKLGSATDESLFEECDVTVISGLFNFRLNSGRNREFINTVLGLAYKYSSLGVACNFVTDRVDFKDPLMHYQSPSDVLDIAYGCTRNVTLRQDYMPFEYSVFLDRRDHFAPESAVFSHLGWEK